MQDVIKIKSASYKRYEELLLKKEALLKEAQVYKIAYNQVFDALSKEVAAARVDCVKKRKIISYCKSVISLGKLIIRSELDEFVEKAMKDYQDTLDYLSGSSITTDEKKIDSPEHQKEIKATYRKLAKLIHPDVNNDLINDEIIADLWNRTNIAYNCNNLEELEELSVLVNRYLESINQRHIDIDIPDINEKIFLLNKEIYTITHTEPYEYKYIMENQDSVNHKLEELNKELNDYQRYLKELDDQIEEFDTLIEED